jgi:hypothetical protein
MHKVVEEIYGSFLPGQLSPIIASVEQVDRPSRHHNNSEPPTVRSFTNNDPG